MADYDLGTARGKVVVDFDDKATKPAAEALGDVGKAADDAGDKSEKAGARGNAGMNLLKGGAILAAGAVAAVAAKIFLMGFDRAVAIENAEAKMRGLGYTTEEVDSIMANALASVKGTAFGLGDAASLAAMAVAAGIQPGAQLEEQLKLTANAASAMGVPMQEVGDIMQSVWTNGSISMVEVNEIMGRGIPILQDLAKAYGVSTDDMQKMVSNGEVDIGRFTEVMKTSVGTVADEMGKTFEGTSMNVEAAFSRMGASAAANLLPYLTQLGQILIQLIDGFNAQFGPAIAQITSAIGAGLVAALQGAITGFQQVVAWVGQNADLVGTLVSTVGAGVVAYKLWQAAITVWSNVTKVATAAQVLFNAVMNANPVMLLVTAIAALVGGLIYFFTQTELGRTIWANFMQFLQEAWANIVSVATTVWTAVADFFTTTWTNISNFVSTVVGNIVNFIVDAWNNVITFLTPIFEFIATLIRIYIEIWINIIIVMAAVLVTIWNAIADAAKWVWETIYNFVQPIIKNIADFITTVFTEIGNFIRDVWQGYLDFITPIALAIYNFVRDTIQNVQNVWNTVWGAISSFFMTIWNAIVSFLAPIVSRVQSTVTNAVNTVQGVWNSVWSAISSFFSDIWNGIVNAVTGAVGNVISVVGGIFGQIMGALSGAGNWLFGVGQDIINGLVQGITSMLGDVISAIGDTVNGAINWAKETLGIHSPSKVFADIGEDTLRGLMVGIDDLTPDLNNQMVGLAGGLSATMQASLDAMPSDSTVETGARTLNYHNHGAGGLSSEDELFDAMKRAKVVVPGW